MHKLPASERIKLQKRKESFKESLPLIGYILFMVIIGLISGYMTYYRAQLKQETIYRVTGERISLIEALCF